jgi:hypothetical protein
MSTAVSFGAQAPPFALGSGCIVYLPLAFLTALPSVAGAGPVGTASIVLPWPNNPAYNGVNFGFQVLSLDPGAPLGYTLSNALDVFSSF